MTMVATKDVGRAKTANTEQLVVRVPKPLRERLEALTSRMAPAAGITLTLTDVLRAALVKGVETLEAEHAPPPPARRK